MAKKDKDIDLDTTLEKAVEEKKDEVKIGHLSMKVEQVKIGSRTINLGTIKL